MYTGLIQNSNNCVENYINFDEDNPFKKIANFETARFYFDYKETYKNLCLSIFDNHPKSCKRHFLLLNTALLEYTENSWKLFEVLHDVVKYLPIWQSFLNSLKSFHRGVTNETHGKYKMHLHTYHILGYLIDYYENNISADVFKCVKMTGLTWRKIMDRFNTLKKLLPINHHECTCDDYIYYPEGILRHIVNVKHIDFKYIVINNIINNIVINYDDIFEQFHIQLITNLNTPIISSINLPYDLLSQKHRIHYINSFIHYRDNGVSTFMFNTNYIRKLNTCFTCDKLLAEPMDYIQYKNDYIMEEPLNNDYVYPILQKCQSCKLQFNFKIDTNGIIFMRNYKWMTYFMGAYDEQSVLSHVPLDVHWLIIILYQYLR
jgi:hypothetical protein